MARLEYLSKRDLNRIHDSSMDILEHTGVVFRHPAAVEAFRAAGAKVQGNRVFLNRELVRRELQKAPDRFTLYARNPSNNLLIGGDSLVFAPGYGAPFVLDLGGSRRKARFEDYINFVKLVQVSDHYMVNGGILVEPGDVPEERRHLEMMYAALSFSDKCLLGSVGGADKARDCLEMVGIAFGGLDKIKANPAMITLINPITPLVYDERMLGALMEYASWGQALVIASLALAGSTSPVTLAGTLTLQNAEILAGIVLAQLINEGTPVVYGSASSVTDMQYASVVIGTSETALIAAATAQMARYYSLPSRGGGGLTDAKLPDAQSGYESMLNLLVAALAGINFVLHAGGILERYMTMSYEKLVIDEEICGLVRRFLAGFEVDDSRLAVELVNRVGPGGQFLTEEHTLYHHRLELQRPVLSDRSIYDIWKNSGARTIRERAVDRCQRMLGNYRCQELPPAVVKALREYLSKKGCVQVNTP